MSRSLLAARNGNVFLDLSSGGTFTRSSEGSYFTQAWTDGSTAFLAWAAANVRRIEDRGDGLGPMLLMEGSRTNYVVQSRAMGTSPWVAAGAPTYDVAQGPDGALLADRNAVTGVFGNYNVVTQPGGPACGSVYAKRAAGSGAGVAQIALAYNTQVGVQRAIGESAWLRIDGVVGNSSVGTFIPVDGRGIYSGMTSQALDYQVDLHQSEAGTFPSSAIRTLGSTVTRGADALSYAVGQYPASMCTTGYAFDFAPDFVPADVISNNTPMLLNGMDAGSVADGLLLSYNVATQPRLFVDAALKFTPVFTWAARGQKMTITVRPSAGTIEIAGATTGNGVHSVGAWVVPGDAPLYIGGRSDAFAACAYFGRISNLRAP